MAKLNKMAPRMKRCYIYTRVSTEMQVDGYSLSAQEDLLRKEAEHRGYQVVEVFSDRGISGVNTTDRDAFNEMIRRITNDNEDAVEYVYVFKLSRFGRNTADVVYHVQLMEDYGVKLFSVTDNLDSGTPTAKLVLPMMASFAELEHDNINTQTMAGKLKKSSIGGWCGGQSPLGYRLENGKLVIDEEEAEIVRIIYDLYLNSRKGMAGIAKWLNVHGYRKKIRGNGKYDTFTAHTIKLILDNEIYCGKMSYGKRKNEKIKGTRNKYHKVKQKEYPVYEGMHEAIIDEETWNAVQHRRQMTGIQNEKKHGMEHAHMITGILKCPICGDPMYGRPGRKKRKDGTYYENSLNTWYYFCKHDHYVDDKPCTFGQINQRDIDAEVWELMQGVLEEGGFDKAMQEALDSQVNPDKLSDTLKTLKDSRRKAVLLKDRRSNDIDRLDIDDPAYDMKYEDLQRKLDEAYTQIVAIDQEIKSVEAQIYKQTEADATLRDAHAILMYISQHADKIMSEEDRRDVIHDFVKEIQIYPKKTDDGWIKEITFNFPVVLNGEESRSFQHCDTTVETVVCLRREKI